MGCAVSPPETCPICRRPCAWKKILPVQDTETKQDFFIFECSSCGAQRTWPVPADLAPYYAGELGSAMKKSGGALYSALKKCLLKIEMRRLASLGAGVTFLDVGCGNGDFGRFLHEAGHKVIAVDVEPQKPEALKPFEDLLYRAINYETYEIKGLGKIENGAVILRHLAEHLKDPLLFLQKLAGQGVRYFYLALPNAQAFERFLLGPYWFFWDPPRHLWHFTPRTLETLFKSAGIEILKQGRDISPVAVPSMYRFLRLKGAPGWLYHLFSPKGSLCGLLGFLNYLLPKNTLWMLGRLNCEEDLR